MAQSIGSTASHQWEGASIPEAAKDTQPAGHWYLLDQQRGLAEVGECLAGIHSLREYVFSVHCVQSTVLGPEDPAVDKTDRASIISNSISNEFAFYWGKLTINTRNKLTYQLCHMLRRKQIPSG